VTAPPAHQQQLTCGRAVDCPSSTVHYRSSHAAKNASYHYICRPGEEKLHTSVHHGARCTKSMAPGDSQLQNRTEFQQTPLRSLRTSRQMQACAVRRLYFCSPSSLHTGDRGHSVLACPSKHSQACMCSRRHTCTASHCYTGNASTDQSVPTAAMAAAAAGAGMIFGCYVCRKARGTVPAATCRPSAELYWLLMYWATMVR
jgi:hypothetical protein